MSKQKIKKRVFGYEIWFECETDFIEGVLRESAYSLMELFLHLPEQHHFKKTMVYVEKREIDNKN